MDITSTQIPYWRVQITSLLKIGSQGKEIAKSFHTDQRTVSAINMGDRWGWLTGATKDMPLNGHACPRKPSKARGRAKDI